MPANQQVRDRDAAGQTESDQPAALRVGGSDQHRQDTEEQSAQTGRVDRRQVEHPAERRVAGAVGGALWAAIPGVLRPLFAWADLPPADGIFAILLILLMFVAPRGLVGMWRQYLPRVVRVVPRPAGSTDAATTPAAPAAG